MSEERDLLVETLRLIVADPNAVVVESLAACRLVSVARLEEIADEIHCLREAVSSWQEIAADRQAAHAALVNESERLRGEVERLRIQYNSACETVVAQAFALKRQDALANLEREG